MKIYEIFSKYPKIITDSRQAVANSIFFALTGETFDGNNFAAKALAGGCNYAVVDNPKVVTDQRYILVENVLIALQDLARTHRKELNIPVIGITGSNGKTTTKELLNSVLREKYTVFSTSGNLNNHIGVPLSILGITKQTQIAIIEMGANHVGEIRDLCRIAQPTCGLITNIGKAHLEGFGGLEGVKRAKKELYDYLDEHSGTIFYNDENKLLKNMLENSKAQTISYSSNCKGQVLTASPLLNINLQINKNSYSVSTRIAGAYNLENILAAACVGVHFAVSEKQITSAIEAYTPQNNRSQIYKTENNQLFLDYYNANPTSMSESLNNFFKQIRGAKMVIIGDMFELGDETRMEHEAIVDLILRHDAVRIVVGENFYQAAKNKPEVMSFRKLEELKEKLATDPPKDMSILLKGSRGMKLEELTELL